ncbi:carboxymuconolactone decarboxylase family protein, partial [Nocardia farcinica]|uniref:carboxymuconolactone decarboxylase family protein n=1 Tax=Nocardia farcinica TaxID=37329 RepID=UPI003CC7EAD0
CITGHTTLAHRTGASDAEIMEAIWVAADMRAGGAFAHYTIAVHTPSWGAFSCVRPPHRLSNSGRISLSNGVRAAVALL